jgi:hypothetical protein
MDSPPIFQLVFQLSPLWFCFGCSCLLFRGFAARKWIAADWRIFWAFTVVLMGCVCGWIAEIAGAMQQLARGPVLGAWLVVDFALLIAVLRIAKPNLQQIPAALREAWGKLLPKSTGKNLPAGWNVTLLTLGVVFLVGVGIVALQCPTNVWDSMTYHVPRVMHWLQQRGLAHYGTNNIRQLESAPGAELQTATLFLLSGGDWPLNLPEWFALVTCAVMASLLAERFLLWQFGKTPLDPVKMRFCGLFAALIAMTIPAALPDAISTQNDLMATQWLMLFGVFGLLLAQEPGNRLYALGAAAAIALGVDNKVTMFINAATFIVALGIWLLVKSPRMALTLGVFTVVLLLAVNAPWMARNERLFHSPLGSQVTPKNQELESHAPTKLAANLLRNLGLYANTPFTSVTDAIHQVFLGLFKAIGEPTQDTGSVWMGTMFSLQPNAVVKNDDGFGGMMTVLPGLLAVIFFLVKFKWKSPLLLVPALAFAGFALFSFYLKWQPWHPRLHLPFFMMAAPFAGFALGWIWNRWVVLTVGLLLLLNAVFVLYYNFQYPIYLLSDPHFQTREERYFCRRPELYPGTAELANDLVKAGVTNVILKIGPDSWEYPLWAFLKDRGFHGTIQHAFITNESATLAMPNFDLPGTAILSEDELPPSQPEFGLRVTCENWTAQFPSKPETRMKLVANQMVTGVGVPQAARLVIHCTAIDQNGQSVTNNVLRLRVGNSSQDYPLTGAPLEMTCWLQAGQNMMGIFLVNPPTPEQRIVTLANFTSGLAAP